MINLVHQTMPKGTQQKYLKINYVKPMKNWLNVYDHEDSSLLRPVNTSSNGVKGSVLLIVFPGGFRQSDRCTLLDTPTMTQTQVMKQYI